jgi:hypothetical protein
MSDRYNLDKLAAQTAIARWFGDEGNLAHEIQKKPLDDQLLKRWLVSWMVARIAPIPKREDLRWFLNEVAKPALISTHPTDYELVETLCKQALDKGILRGRPTSLMSKFAFSCRPATFAPYDKYARGALRDFGHKIPDHGYALYMQAFIAEKAKIIERLHNLGITPSKLPYRGKIMEDALFEMRVVDKRLMLYSGFPPERMARDFSPTDFRLVHKR